MKIHLNKQKSPTNKDQWFLILIAVLLVLLGVVAVFLLHDNRASKSQEYAQKAREYYDAGDYETALLYLRRGMEKEEEIDAASLMMMADCYEALGNYPKALETLRKMNTADPAVAGRIQAIEQRRSANHEAELVTIVGCSFDENTQDAVLDDKGITDEQLTEVAALHSLNSLSL